VTVQFKIDALGNLELLNGNLQVVDDVAQRITTRLRMLFGEWFLDTRDGTPYLQSILIKSPNVDHIRAISRARILGTEGVIGINSLEMDFDHVRRKLSVTCEAKTETGNVEVSI
jgi:hypothetical protein